MARRLGLILKNSFLHFLPIKKEPLVIFTDGSCANNGCFGSFGIYAGLHSPLTCSVSMKSRPDSPSCQHAESIAIIYALKKVLALGMDTCPVVIFTDRGDIVKTVGRLQALATRYKLIETESNIVEDISNVKMLNDNVTQPGIPLDLTARINTLREKCGSKREMYTKRERELVAHLFTVLESSIQEVQKKYKAANHQKRGALIRSTEKWLCSHCATPELALSSATAGKRKVHKEYTDVLYLLAKACRKGCVFVHVPGHCDHLQNELADFLARVALQKALLVEETAEDSWQSNRRRRKPVEKRLGFDYEPQSISISYEPLCYGNIRFPKYFPKCEEIWNSSTGELDDFIREKILVDSQLNSTWTDEYIQRNWTSLDSSLKSKWHRLIQTYFSNTKQHFHWIRGFI